MNQYLAELLACAAVASTYFVVIFLLGRKHISDGTLFDVAFMAISGNVAAAAISPTKDAFLENYIAFLFLSAVILVIDKVIKYGERRRSRKANH